MLIYITAAPLKKPIGFVCLFIKYICFIEATIQRKRSNSGTQGQKSSFQICTADLYFDILLFLWDFSEGNRGRVKYQSQNSPGVSERKILPC